MRVLLLADGLVGKKIADFLIEHYPSDLVQVITTKVNDIYNMAEAKGIPVCVYDTDDNVKNMIVDEIDLGVLAWWPRIIKKSLLYLPKHGFINTHPSLLPYNRGKHPNFWAIVEQAPFGVTLHFADPGIDTGDIVAQSKIVYDWCDTGETLYKKAQTAMVELFCKTYPVLRTGKYGRKSQDKSKGSFHLSSEIELASKIDLESSYRARDLLNLLRARTFDGYPGCWFEENGERFEISVKIRKVGK